MNSWISREHRCICGKLLFKGMILEGFLESKCRYCGRIIKIEGALNKKNFHSLVINSECRILNISDSIVDLLGFSKLDMIGKGIEDFDVMDINRWNKIFEKTKLMGSVLFRTSYRNSKGNLLPVTIRTISFNQNRREYVLIILRPTEENHILKINEKIGSDFGDITMHLDTSGNIGFVEMTSEAIKILKYSNEDIFHKSIFDFFSQEHLQKSKDNFQEAVKSEKSLRAINNILTKDGKIVKIESYLIPHYDNFGSFCGFESSGWIRKDC